MVTTTDLYVRLLRTGNEDDVREQVYKMFKPDDSVATQLYQAEIIARIIDRLQEFYDDEQIGHKIEPTIAILRDIIDGIQENIAPRA